MRKLTPSDLVRMNLPEVFWRTRVDGVQGEARGVVDRYVDQIEAWIERGVGFLITGSPGTGKTGAAAVLAKAAKAVGLSVYFTRMSELRDAVKEGTKFSEDEGILERCRTVNFLVVDGVQKEDAAAPYFGASHLVDLVMLRGDKRRATVVTMALTDDEIKASTLSRLRVSCATYLQPLVLRGEDLRKKQAEEIQRQLRG